ncbi:MAG: serine hydrolase, partial [Bermanella sp.]|nr:serine hydrolase [Bermanella sp.]
MSLGKIAGRLFAAIIAVILVGSAVFHTEIRQLYNTVRLFDADVIVEHFSHMDDVAPIKTLTSNEQVRTLTPALAQLPETFTYQGEERSLQDWISGSSTTALVVIQDENLVFEDYYLGTQATDKRISWSMAKSFLSALFGIAVSEGKIQDLDAAVTDYVPELKGSGYDGVSIKNVLQMSSGVYFNEDYGDFNSDINRFGRVMALGGSFD